MSHSLSSLYSFLQLANESLASLFTHEHKTSRCQQLSKQTKTNVFVVIVVVSVSITFFSPPLFDWIFSIYFSSACLNCLNWQKHSHKNFSWRTSERLKVSIKSFKNIKILSIWDYENYKTMNKNEKSPKIEISRKINIVNKYFLFFEMSLEIEIRFCRFSYLSKTLIIVWSSCHTHILKENDEKSEYVLNNLYLHFGSVRRFFPFYFYNRLKHGKFVSQH